MFRRQVNLKACDHGVLFYRNPTHKRQVLFNFVREGLDRGEGVFFVAGDESPGTICDAMLDFGFDVEGLEGDGQLKVVNCNGWYLVDGKVDTPNVMALWRRTHEEALERGLKGLNVCGEMGCFFRHNLVEELVEYEKTCGKKLAVPMTALCAYSPNDVMFLQAKLFLDLVRSHSHVFSPSFTGPFDFEGFYRKVLPEKLEDAVGETYAKGVLAFLNKWRRILEADLGEGPEAPHTALRGLIGPQADVVEKKISHKIYEKFGLGLPHL